MVKHAQWPRTSSSKQPTKKGMHGLPPLGLRNSGIDGATHQCVHDGYYGIQLQPGYTRLANSTSSIKLLID